jgi:hypothetical protein
VCVHEDTERGSRTTMVHAEPGGGSRSEGWEGMRHSAIAVCLSV